MKIGGRLTKVRIRRNISNRLIYNRGLWMGVIFIILVSILFYKIGSLFEDPPLQDYFSLLITVQGTFLSIIVAVLMASISTSDYTTTTKYIYKKKNIVWKLIGLFLVSITVCLIFFLGHDELTIISEIPPLVLISYIGIDVNIIPSMFAISGATITGSVYYLVLARGVIFADETSISRTLTSLISHKFPHSQIQGNLERSDTPLGYYYRFVEDSVSSEDSYAIDSAIEDYQEVTIKLLQYHSYLVSIIPIRQSEILVSPLEEICQGWEGVAATVVDAEYEYAIRSVMSSQSDIIQHIIEDIDQSMGEKEISSEFFETYFDILGYAFENDLYYYEIYHGRIGDPESRIRYKWHLNILKDELFDRGNKNIIGTFTLYMKRMLGERDIPSKVEIELMGILSNWLTDIINEHPEEMRNEFNSSNYYHNIYTRIERVLLEFGPRFRENDPRQLIGWILCLVYICDASSKNPVLKKITHKEKKEEIVWPIARVSETIGQLYRSLEIGEEIFAEILALLMHICSKESVDLGLDRSSRSAVRQGGSSYKISRSPVLKFDRYPSFQMSDSPELSKLAHKKYEEMEFKQDNAQDQLESLLDSLLDMMVEAGEIETEEDDGPTS